MMQELKNSIDALFSAEVKNEINKIAEEKNKQKLLELITLAHRLFIENEEGKRFLGLLKERFLLRREIASPALNSAYAYHAEGENNVIRMLSYLAEIYPMVVKSMQVTSK